MVEDVLRQLGLAERMHATAAELSGGEAQRAALAQLLLLRPQLFVADEFLAAIDPGIGLWILDECRAVIKQTRGAAGLALHDVHAALHVSDSIVLLWPGLWEEKPWTVTRGSPLWEADALHALLCICRWIKDLRPTRGLKELLRYAARLAKPATADLDGLPKESGPILLDDDGRIRNISTEGITPLTIADEILRGRGAPLRGTFQGRDILGVVLPFGTDTTRTLLAYTEFGVGGGL